MPVNICGSVLAKSRCGSDFIVRNIGSTYLYVTLSRASGLLNFSPNTVNIRAIYLNDQGLITYKISHLDLLLCFKCTVRFLGKISGWLKRYYRNPAQIRLDMI